MVRLLGVVRFFGGTPLGVGQRVRERDVLARDGCIGELHTRHAARAGQGFGRGSHPGVHRGRDGRQRYTRQLRVAGDGHPQPACLAIDELSVGERLLGVDSADLDRKPAGNHGHSEVELGPQRIATFGRVVKFKRDRVRPVGDRATAYRSHPPLHLKP